MSAQMTHPQRWRALRILPWVVAAILLLLPAIAMRFEVEGVAWTASDFLAMGAILFIACACFEIAARRAPNFTYLLAAASGIGAGFLLTWVNLAVGIVGDGPVNLMFFAVVLVAIAGTIVARCRAAGMARAMMAAAGAFVLAIGIGLMFFRATAVEAGLSLVLLVPWLASAGFFHLSARDGA